MSIIYEHDKSFARKVQGVKKTSPFHDSKVLTLLILHLFFSFSIALHGSRAQAIHFHCFFV
jgi:hypothetical protein